MIVEYLILALVLRVLSLVLAYLAVRIESLVHVKIPELGFLVLASTLKVNSFGPTAYRS